MFIKNKNVKLFIILLGIVFLVALTFLLPTKSPTVPTNTTTDGGFFDFLNFSKNKTGNNTSNDSSDGNNIDGSNFDQEMSMLKLTKISSGPISGYGVFTKERFTDVPAVVSTTEEGVLTAPPTEFTTVLRYQDKISGDIYQTFIDKIEERKISEAIIPGIHEVFFGNGGESIIIRYLKQDNETISTFEGLLPKDVLGGDSGNTKVLGSFLPDNIKDMTTSPDSSKFFYLANTINSAVGIVYDPLAKNKVQVFDSPFTEWLSTWPNEEMITVTTKPSGLVAGYMYIINPKNKDFRKILGGINGLTTQTSPSGRIVLYGKNDASLSVYDIENGITRDLSIKTIPEKCVWASDSSAFYCAVPEFIENDLYPDSWYQGLTSFTDTFWKVSIENLTETNILDSRNLNGANLDAIKLTLSGDMRNLFFINKQDSYLWGIKLK